MITGMQLVFTLLCIIVVPGSHTMGRPPERVDYIACQVQLYEKLDKIQEVEDPNARVEAYFNRSGFPCKTYCKFRSCNIDVAKMTKIIDSPYYVMCAKDRYCSKGGKCKRIGTPLKLDENQTTDHETEETTKGESITTKAHIPSTSTHKPGAESTTEGAQDDNKKAPEKPSGNGSDDKPTSAPKSKSDKPTKTKNDEEE